MKRSQPSRIFSIVLYTIIALLLLTAIRYNANYFLSTFFPSTTELPGNLYLFLVVGQILCVAAALALFVFRKTVYKKRKEFLLLLGTVVVCFVVLELASRLYVCSLADSAIQAAVLFPDQCGMRPKYEPHHYLNYHGTPNYVSPNGLNMHNSRGFRGPDVKMPKPANVYRIVTIGGSSTYTENVEDWRKDFARQLERKLSERGLKVEVMNAGLGGWNSWESLINLQLNVLEVDPDLIIIYHGTNDVHTRLVHPDSYASDNSGRRTQWRSFSIPLMFRSTLVRLVTGVNPLGHLGSFVDTPTTAALTKETGFVPQLGGTAMEALEQNPPIYFERNLKNMTAIAQAHNISVLLATWAHTPVFNDYSATPHYERGYRENNDVVKSVAETTNVHLYDFANEMPRKKEFWSDGRHVNEAGAELKGELFANYIYENPRLQKEILVKNGEE